MLAFTQVARADGSFTSSDPRVDLIWQSSVRTAADMVSPPVDLDPRGCEDPSPAASAPTDCS
jgi:hypothetical protein